ncbi:MAG: 50S ribosomal protein L9 [Candidatus Omnitrophica bacterium]|nr:50S ribosomal protein L9 [Candidatus Omnitrophota bacterium]
MKVILNQNVENLGSVGDVLQVRDGYARNFLIPRQMAAAATPSNIKVVEREKAKEIQKERELKSAAEAQAKKIRSISVTAEVMAGDEGKLFGSVTSADIEGLLAAQGITVDKKDILVSKPIRKVGAFEVEVRCYTNVKAALKVWVVGKKDKGAEPAAAAGEPEVIEDAPKPVKAKSKKKKESAETPAES